MTTPRATAPAGEDRDRRKRWNPDSDHPLGKTRDIFFDHTDITDVARGWQIATHRRPIRLRHPPPHLARTDLDRRLTNLDALARRLLHDPDTASIEDRAAACLILLYAQPAAKIAALTASDVKTRDGDTYLALGPEPLLLIPPLDTLVTALPVAKPFGTASTLADARWLFTGKNAGTHLHPASLMARMNRLGITTRASRNTALLHLASTTPPAVFASLVGISIGTATRWAALAGSSWNSYATLPR